MGKIFIIFFIFITVLTAQTKVLWLSGDGGDNVYIPSGYQSFETSDGETFNTSASKALLVPTALREDYKTIFNEVEQLAVNIYRKEEEDENIISITNS